MTNQDPFPSSTIRPKACLKDTYISGTFSDLKSLTNSNISLNVTPLCSRDEQFFF